MAEKIHTLKLDSVETEKEFINVTINNSLLTVQFINDLLPEYFSDPSCKLIIKAIRLYFQKYSGLPTDVALKTLVNKLIATKTNKEKNFAAPVDIDEKIKYIFTEKKLKEHQLKFFEEEIEKFIKMNKVREAFAESIDLIEDVERFDEIEANLKKAILWHADKNLGVEITDVKERYEKIRRIFENFIPLPYKKLSETIGGGLLAKSLTYIAAQSGLGKSIVLDMISFYCWKELGMNVIIASLELSEEVKSLRIDAQFMDRPTRELVKDSQSVEHAYTALGEKGNHLFIKEFPSGTSSKSISRYIHRLKSFYDMRVGLITVDYADIVAPNSMKKVSLYADGGDVSEELRYLGYEYDCPVLTATQLNRCGSDLPIEDLSRIHIAESNKKFNTSDSMIVFGGTPDQRAQGQLYAKTLKARHGREGVIIPFRADYQYLKISEI